MRKLKIDIAGALVLVNWSLATVLHHPPLAPRIVVARAHISSVLCNTYNSRATFQYTGRRGFGAQLNGFPLAVTGETKLNRALLVCEMGSRRDAVR